MRLHPLLRLLPFLALLLPAAGCGGETPAQAVGSAVGPAITGRVYLDREQQVPAGEGIFVLAWQEGLPPSREEVLKIIDGQPSSTAFTRTGSDGSFRIGGLKEGVYYMVTAGAPGLVTFRDRAKVKAFPDDAPPPSAEGGPPREVTITVQRLCGVKLRIREIGGQALRTSHRLYPFPTSIRQRQDYWPMNLESGMAYSPSTIPSLLAGLQPGIPVAKDRLPLSSIHRNDAYETSWEDSSPYERLMLFVARDGYDRVGPITTKVVVPGYQPTYLEAWAKPVEEGIPEVVAELSPSARSWGSLEVTFTGGEGDTPPPNSPPRPVGAMVLEFQGSTYLVPVMRLPESGTFVVDDLPTGRWRVGYVDFLSLFRSPPAGADPLYVQVGGRPGHFAVDVPSQGAVVLKPVDEAGEPYTGRMLLEMHSWEGKKVTGQSFLGFAGPPYVIANLPPDDYSFSVTFPGVVQIPSGEDALSLPVDGDVQEVPFTMTRLPVR